MHYYSWRQFERCCEQLSLSVIDVVEHKLADGAERGFSDRKLYRWVLPLLAPLRRLGLLLPVYRAFRWIGIDTFQLILRHQRKPDRGGSR
jgi:hypothetical protein